MPPKYRKLMVPTRVEPKVHLANERVFQGWTHYALFLLNGATAMARFSAGRAEMLALRVLGIGVSVSGVLFLFVGLYVHQARQRKISWNPEYERLDATLPLFVILATVTFAVATNWYIVYGH